MISSDGYLPDNITEDMIPGNRPEDIHYKSCPCHEDSEPTWDVQGWLVTECICSAIKAAIDADRAEHEHNFLDNR